MWELDGTASARIASAMALSPFKTPTRLGALRSAAFSLIEVLISSAIISLAGAGMLLSMTHLQQQAVANRAYTMAHIILRNASDRSMHDGWSDLAPRILDPTIPDPSVEPAGNVAGDFFDHSTDITDTNADGSPKWEQWDMPNNIDCSDERDPVLARKEAVALIYDNMENPYLNSDTPGDAIVGKLYRKVQLVHGSTRMAWVTFQVRYTIRSKEYAQFTALIRAVD